MLATVAGTSAETVIISPQLGLPLPVHKICAYLWQQQVIFVNFHTDQETAMGRTHSQDGEGKDTKEGGSKGQRRMERKNWEAMAQKHAKEP
ncbi:hypothetical protein ANN_05010 [Periplaneta americana]|uniref:Uncharacterized protein n=1 Tax=Periplaneta americana TaxID=6978 RepID=A0ABQ8TC19_PERAM|nr:hypothetical protein ANN_05010 [Periplaneta americana]